MVKRIISSVIGLPLVIALLVFGNKYMVDVTISIVAIISLYEYFNAFNEQSNNKNLRWIGYIVAILIAFIHVIPSQYLLNAILAVIPICTLVLFSQIIATDMKYNIKDVAFVFFGICYIIGCLIFIPIIRETTNGRIMIWFVFITAWGTDIFAYFIGRKFGKHKFSKISPNKSVEGCIAGVIGSIICMIIYAIVCNCIFNTDFNYLTIMLIGFILSLVGQIGDFAASSIKRYTKIKDFGNIIPGHGGILDRIDSVIFIAPFAYFLLQLGQLGTFPFG